MRFGRLSAVSNNSEPWALIQIWQQIQANIVMLGVAGAAGAFAKAVVAPEGRLRRRIAQAVVGFLSAIFLGSLLAPFVEPFTSNPYYAWLASGFLCGFGGEAIVDLVQRRITGRPQ